MNRSNASLQIFNMQFNPNQTAPAQAYQLPAAQAIPALPVKIAGSREPYPVEVIEDCLSNIAFSAVAIGQSFQAQNKPAEVPPQAPDLSEWRGLGKEIIAWGPEYASLLKSRANAGTKKNKRSPASGLVYIHADLQKAFESAGVFTQAEEHDETGAVKFAAGTFSFPVDAECGGISITTRQLAGSAMGALVDHYGLKKDGYVSFAHPAVSALFQDSTLEYVANKPPKDKKPKKIDPNAPVKPAKAARVKKVPIIYEAVLDEAGVPVVPAQMRPRILSTLLGNLVDCYILSLRPRNVDQATLNALQSARETLVHKTELRNLRKKAADKVAHDKAKVEKVTSKMAPNNVQTLEINPNFQVNPAGQAGIGSYVPQPTPSYTQAPAAAAPAFGGNSFVNFAPGSQPSQ